LLIELIDQINSIAKRNSFLFIGLKDDDLTFVQQKGAENSNLQIIQKLYNKDNQLILAEIKNDFITNAIDDWYGSLAEKNK